MERECRGAAFQKRQLPALSFLSPPAGLTMLLLLLASSSTASTASTAARRTLSSSSSGSRRGLVSAFVRSTFSSSSTTSSSRALSYSPSSPRTSQRFHGPTPFFEPRRFTPSHLNAASGTAIADAPVKETIKLPTNDKSPNLLRIRHTSAHVMAMAVQRLFPSVQVTIGPWIENGFYYDFDTGDTKFTEEDLSKIKKEMERIIKKRMPLRREEVSREEARKRIVANGEKYKLEILDGIKTEPITIYHIGEEWWDLCAGPHVESTGDLPANAIKLESLAGAYWRGDEKNAMLTRIYGTAWESKDQLREYQRVMEEAKKRDHRVLGKKLDLFSIQEDAGGGLVFWHPKGATIRKIIEDFWKDEHERRGYALLYTPHMANLNLWKTSGHFDFYKEGMFDQMEVETEAFQIRPMNCPFHCLIYKDTLRSYRELPIRWAELGTVYRYERSGTLHGLMRVRGFTQDDAHIFCLPSQLQEEIRGVLDLVESILSKFGFSEYEVMLSTQPEKSVGSPEIWTAATAALVGALERKGWGYEVDEGGGAFYGPKIDIKIRDAIGRLWQCSTIQCDFNLPERFGLEYVADDGAKKRPIMVHRAIFGSIERFFGILVENTAGDFPLWMSPVQMRLLPVTDKAFEHAQAVKKRLALAGYRVEVDAGSERLGKQIRNAEQARIPVMGIIGAKEVESGGVTIRTRLGGQLGLYEVEELVAGLGHAVAETKELHEVLEVREEVKEEKEKEKEGV